MEQLPNSAPPPATATETTTALPIRHLEFKVALLLALTLVLSVAFVAYVLYARGVFESTQHVVLVTDDSDGVAVGMPLTFAGFAIGRVRGIELAQDAKVRIRIDVPRKDAHWLRTTSVFIIERALVGGVRIRAVTGVLDAPPLPDGAVRTVLRGDATEELPKLLSAMKELLENLQALTAADSSLGASLANVRTVTERMTGRYGALSVALGNDENARKVVASIDRANALLESLSGVSARLDQSLVKVDQRVFAKDGVMDETEKAVRQLNGVLGDVRDSLRKADAILADAQKIGTNARAATDDLATLRAEVEASLRKVGALISEINRKWPFARDAEVKLP
jgi:phospholipid/cholesterol/gamma-HCH transport system substrate-binding protein